jgi:hypothetical protein
MAEKSEFGSQQGQKIFLHSIQSNLGAHIVSYPMVGRTSIPRGKAAVV